MNRVHLEEQLMVITAATYDRCMAADPSGDTFALYMLYYRTAKRQGTQLIWATENYCTNAEKGGLSWSHRRFLKAKKTLKELDLVRKVVRREGQRIVGWYLEIRYTQLKEPDSQQVQFCTPSDVHSFSSELLQNSTTNSLHEHENASHVQLNALHEQLNASHEEPPRPPNKGDIPTVFHHHCKVMSNDPSKPRTWRLTAGIRDKISTRLKTFSAEELMRAATNLSKSEFHRGNNDHAKEYCDPSWLYHSDERTDKWANMIPGKQPSKDALFHAPDEKRALYDAIQRKAEEDAEAAK